MRAAALAALLLLALVLPARAEPPLAELLRASADLSRPEAERQQAFVRARAGGRARAPELVALLRDADPAVRGGAASVLALVALETGPLPEATDALVARVESDPMLGVRMNAALALAFAEDPRVVAPLARALGDPAFEMRLAAATALGRSRRPEAVAPLVARIAVETQPEVARELVTGLGRLRATRELEALRRASADPALRDQIEAELYAAGALDAAVERERRVRRAEAEAAGLAEDPRPTLAQARAEWLFALLATRRALFEPLSLALLLLPALGLLGHACAHDSLAAGLARLAAASAFVLAAVGLGGFFAFGALRGLRADPGSALVVLIPFAVAARVAPLALCAAFVGLRAGGGVRSDLANGVLFGALHLALAFATWHAVPMLLEGRYFQYGRHPEFASLELRLALALAFAVAGVRAALRTRGGRRALPRDLSGASLARAGIPCAASLALGTLIMNLYRF